MALKLLTSSIALLHAVAWLSGVVRTWIGDAWLAGHRRLVMRAVGSVFEPCEVDPTKIRHRIRAGILGEADLLVVLVEDLDVEPEALELLDQDLERLGNARRWISSPLTIAS